MLLFFLLPGDEAHPGCAASIAVAPEPPDEIRVMASNGESTPDRGGTWCLPGEEGWQLPVPLSPT
jgi:hypothetical protein